MQILHKAILHESKFLPKLFSLIGCHKLVTLSSVKNEYTYLSH